MKKEHIILLAAGVVLACLIIKSGKGTSLLSKEYIKPGDKGSDVSALQSALTAIAGVQFSTQGAYDTKTLEAVKYYMEGSDALLDYDKGYVCKSFATSLQKIESKLKEK
jgi:hypothetical protein